MYPLILHKNLNEEKWFRYSLSQQVLMIANELNRVKNFILSNRFPEVNSCYERAFELIDLTSADPKWSGNRLKELRRFRELLAQQYISEEKSRERDRKFSDVKNIYTVVESAVDLGFKSMVIETHPRMIEFIKYYEKSNIIKGNPVINPGIRNFKL